MLGLSKKRLELEVSWGGGKVASDLAQATHLVVLGMVDDSQALSERYDFEEKPSTLLLNYVNLFI